MLQQHNRAFKEWDIVCEAMKEGRQIVLIRKGGIREEEGVFRVNDPEFFLMPTHEHQSPGLLQEPFVERLAEMQRQPFDPHHVTIDAYAVVHTVRTCDDEEKLRELADEHIWNPRYLKMRLDYNPYDPLYVMLLRVYNLPNPVTLLMKPDYVGCKSWVTLEDPLSTEGATVAVNDDEFESRRAKLLAILDGR